MDLQLGVFVLLLGLAQMRATRSTTITTLTNATFANGRFGYFAVPRDRVAAKLEELQQSSCHEDFLTLPNNPVLQDLIKPNEHIVAVAYGNLTATSFEESLPAEVRSKYATQANTVQFFIPLLTGTDPCAEPIYQLSLGSFVATDKPFLQPNVAIPTEQVDSINVSSDGLVMKDGCERFEVSWSTFAACESPDNYVVRDFDEFLNQVTVSPRDIPNYPFCDDESGGGQFFFCVDRDIINCPCQVWTHGEVRNCKEGIFSVTSITKKFAEVSLLTDGPQNATITELNEGFYGIGAHQPCIV